MQGRLSAWGAQGVGHCAEECIKTCPQCFLKALDSCKYVSGVTAVHILPLSYEGSAMWGPDHGCLDSGDNPLTSLHRTDEADLHSVIQINPTEPMCHHSRQHRGCKQHSKPCLLIAPLNLLLLPPTHLLQRCCYPNPCRPLAEREWPAPQPLTNLHSTLEGSRRPALWDLGLRYSHWSQWHSWHFSARTSTHSSKTKSI